MSGRNIYDFVQCVPWKRDGEVRAVNGIISPVMYEITGSDASRDKPFIGEVTGAGPGIEPETMCVAPGDVFLCNLHNISYKLTELGRKTYVVRNGAVYARLEKETMTVQPLQDLILVKKNEARALAHMREAGGKLWLPTEDMATDDVRSPAIMAEYGEVVAVGPGRHRDGRWSQPPCKAGDLVIYDGSYSTLPIRIHGESFTLVPAPQLVKVADEG
jgi:co-chaperonin GroES (HSP10)